MIVPFWTGKDKNILNPNQPTNLIALVGQFTRMVIQTVNYAFTAQALYQPCVLLIVPGCELKPAPIRPRNETGLHIKIFSDVDISCFKRKYIRSTRKFGEDNIIADRIIVPNPGFPLSSIFKVEIDLSRQSNASVNSRRSVV